MRLDTINVRGIQGEALPSVVEHDARSLYHHPAAEGLVEAIDHGDGIPISVDHGQIDGVPFRAGELRWSYMRGRPVVINP